MNDIVLQLYHRMPSSSRSLVASLRGYYLRSWRYGSQTDRLVREAHEREHWSARRWKIWQDERLAMLLDRAATRVPYYRKQWAARRRNGDQASWEYLENWPILEKEPLRANAQAFVADDCDPRRMLHEHTSGTTGKPLSLWWSHATTQAWYGLFEARWRQWYGISRHDRWAILGGQLVAPVAQRQPPFWVWNVGLHQLYMSSYHLAPEYVPAYLEAMRRYDVCYLLGYTSSMVAIAKIALEQGLRVPQLKVVISNAEPLLPQQRELIAEAFRCPVHNTYGMSEIVCGASECNAMAMHLWPEAGVLEVLGDTDDRPVQPGQTGRFIATGLINADMPLIRYQTGDRGAVAPPDQRCACGRTLPLLQDVEGRLDDVVLTADGRRVGRLDPVFKKDLPIREAQIIQESLSHIRVRVVPAAGYAERDQDSIAQRLRDRVGDMEISFEQVERIPRSANGKFRAVICNVPAEERNG